MHRESYRIEKAGNFNRLKRIDEIISEPIEDEVQVRIHAVGLNFADIFAILGLYSATPKEAFIPGLEFSGEIIATGAQVTKFNVGDRVMGVTRFGGYTTHKNISEDYLELIPKNWSYQQGAAFLVQALTAYYGLFTLGNIKKDDTVLIHSAAGGVGLLANRMAQKLGAYTIGTVGSNKKIDLLSKEGFQDWIVRDKNFGKNLEKSLGERELNLIMECIGGKVFKEGYKRLAPMGRSVVYGSARYGSNHNTPNWPSLVYKYITRPFIDPQSMIESNKAILGFNLIWLYNKKELMRSTLESLQQLDLEAPFIGHEYDFQDMLSALKMFQSGKTVGKVIVNVK